MFRPCCTPQSDFILNLYDNSGG
uniref:Uncharacterized protein n=1 Tax=Arundo donax TaxID=35708 RepID=A0A0A8YFX2_ARUDO